ncbi:MAG: DUF2330 domain-containing protein [Armatimonadota bacterium]|jgi:hypothetical protein
MYLRIGSLALLCLIAAHLASADGMFEPSLEYARLHGGLGATSTEQKGVVIEAEEGRETLLIQTTYHGPAADFAWVIPVPGEPFDDDVFIASSAFIDHLLEHTAPIVRTHIATPGKRHDFAGYDYVAPPSDDGMWLSEATVTLHRRMEVGDYDVSVLSATGPEVLIDWLNEHGYSTPEDHADLLGHYVEKSWFFVALRALPAVVEERPVLHDVKPIGIEFATETLTYPLYISRASSREKTALTLIAMTREPVECAELARARVPLGEHGMGTSYARIRRETVERGAEPSAVLEYAGFRGIGNRGLHWREDDPPTDFLDLRALWTTRLWTILDRDEMVDLTFATAALRGDRLVIDRHGTLPGPGVPERIGLRLWPVAAVVFLVLAVGGIGASRIPRALLHVALILGAAAVMLSGGAEGPYDWVLLLTMLAAPINAVFAVARRRDPGEADRMRWWQIAVWTALAAGWVAVVRHMTSAAVWHSSAVPRSRALMILTPHDPDASPAQDTYTDPAGWGQLVTAHSSDAPPDLPLLLFMLWMALLLLEVVRGARHMTPRARGWAVMTFIIASAALVSITGPGMVGLPSALLVIIGNLWTAGTATVLIVMLVAWGTLKAMRRGGRIARREHAAIIISGLVVGALVGLAVSDFSTALRPFETAMVTSSLLLLTLALAPAVLFGLAWAALSSEGRLGQAARCFALTLLVLGAVLAVDRVSVWTPADAGTFVPRHSGVAELDSALVTLDHALRAFLEDTGSYPVTLEDLTGADAPEHALDSSGNVVAGPEDWAGPYLTRLPSDPLTRSRDMWVYEVTGSPMIDSGGLRITISRTDTPGPPF